MKTKAIYKNDRYLSKLQTEILEAVPNPKAPQDALVILKETIFFPGGGGQSCDTGTLNGHPISSVYEYDGEIYHLVPGGASLIESGELASGSLCNIEIDWERRFDNMQRHCGEHILSGVFFDLYGGVNRGFHMGDEYMTIDISLEANPDYKDITWDMAMAAQQKANRIIWQDLPIIVTHFDTKEEASSMPVRKPVAIEEDITIVTVDSVACCGTHPSSSGQVGLIKIYKVEPNKGMFRIFFEAGARALKGYDDRFDVLTELEKDLSAGLPDIMDKYSARKEKANSVRDRLYHLTKVVLDYEKNRILEAMNGTSNPGTSASGTSASVDKAAEINADPSNIHRYNILTVDDVIEIGRSLEGQITGILYLVHNPSNTLLLFSDTVDCGKMVKDNAAVFGGKGGGNQKFARAIFARPDDLDTFVSAIEKLQM